MAKQADNQKTESLSFIAPGLIRKKKKISQEWESLSCMILEFVEKEKKNAALG